MVTDREFVPAARETLAQRRSAMVDIRAFPARNARPRGNFFQRYRHGRALPVLLLDESDMCSE